MNAIESERSSGLAALPHGSAGLKPYPRLYCAIGLDLRSIALVRIAVALVVLLDLGIRATALAAHYTDEGVLPRHLALEHELAWSFSIHLMGGTIWHQTLLFFAAALSALLLASGLYAKPAAIACWLLTVSLQNRNPLVLSNADVLLRLAMFWLLFLPIGARWSLDRIRGTTHPPSSNAFVSVATAAYTLQILLVYISAGLLKLQVTAWISGDGLAYALKAPGFEAPLGMWFARFPELLRIVGKGTPYFEIAAPLLLLIPTRSPVPRLVAIGTFALFHLTIALMLSVGIFSVISIVVWLAFLPAWVWDRLLPAVARYLRIGRSWQGVYLAFEQASASLPPQSHTAWLDRRRLSSVWSAVMCACFSLYVLGWNVSNLGGQPTVGMPLSIRWIGFALRLDQSWNMFSIPVTSGGWFVVPARLSSGASRDLFVDSAEIYWGRPPVIANTFSNDRWRKYMENVLQSGNDWVREGYARSLCRAWNTTHDDVEQLEAFRIVLMSQRIRPWGEPTTARRHVLWNHECRPGLLHKWEGSL